MGRARRALAAAVAGSIGLLPGRAAAQPAGDDAEIEVGAKPAPKPPAAPPPPASAASPPTTTPLLPPPPPRADDEAAALRRDLAAADARIAKLEAASAEQPWTHRLLPPGLALSGYVQAQYEAHADSQDEVVNGTYLNQNRFDVRRGRVRFDAQWQYAELTLEPDFNTVKGPTASIRRAEATLVYRREPFDGVVVRHGPREDAPPLAAVTMGVTDIPFGFELVDAPRERVFMERSQGSLAFFPSEPDVGVRLWGGAGFFRYNIGLFNGEPLSDTASKIPAGDPTSAKDFVARLGVDTHPLPWARLLAGVSALRGEGFHAGSAATKNGLVWTDYNENSVIDPGELAGTAASAAQASQSFDRWAVSGDVELWIDSPIGRTFLYGELTLASNLDRGLFVADPTSTGIDVRELAYYGAITQEVTRYGIVGFRADVYDPNADFLDSRKGQLVPTSSTITTFSPVVGLVLPETANCPANKRCERARLLFQYDVVRDSLGRDARGVPDDLSNNRWTLRLQVEM